MKVLECLLLWKDDYLLPYSHHLKNIISPKDLREELASWSLSKEAESINEHHRSNLVPVVIQSLIPKVRKLKLHASRKVSLMQRVDPYENLCSLIVSLAISLTPFV